MCDTKKGNLDESKTEESESEISDEAMRVFVNLHAGSPQIMSVAQSINDEFHTSVRTAMIGCGEVRFFLNFSDLSGKKVIFHKFSQTQKKVQFSEKYLIFGKF